MLATEFDQVEKLMAGRKPLRSRGRTVSILMMITLTHFSPVLRCSIRRYRMTVIKNLPQLQKLDNTPVQADEVGEAMRRGVELVHPHDRPVPGHDDGYYGSYSNNQQVQDCSDPPPPLIPLALLHTLMLNSCVCFALTHY